MNVDITQCLLFRCSRQNLLSFQVLLLLLLLLLLLQDFESPPGPRFIGEVLLPQLQLQSTKADWRQQTQALLNLRRIAKFHPQLLTPGNAQMPICCCSCCCCCTESDSGREAAQQRQRQTESGRNFIWWGCCIRRSICYVSLQRP